MNKWEVIYVYSQDLWVYKCFEKLRQKGISVRLAVTISIILKSPTINENAWRETLDRGVT